MVAIHPPGQITRTDRPDRTHRTAGLANAFGTPNFIQKPAALASRACVRACVAPATYSVGGTGSLPYAASTSFSSSSLVAAAAAHGMGHACSGPFEKSVET